MKWLTNWPILLGLLLLLVGLPLVGCNRSTVPDAPVIEPPAGPVWFKEITDQVGMDFVQDAGPQNKSFFLPQICGTGGAVFDFDNDGLMDIYLVNQGGPNSPSTNRLFKQMKDHTFKDVSAGSGLDI